jgi:TPP-dependent pyruvate/acetoin dehydrogenase alpha subunit
MVNLTAADLIAFETDIANEFNAGHIRAPVHLYDGNETPMLEVFKDVGPADWVCCGWRSHYQCLLRGVPPDLLKSEIMAGRSISLCFPEYRIVSSAIVGGILPIAVGLGMAIKRRGALERVHCFMGDMTFESGIAHECMKYAGNHGLPVRFIIEHNGKSVCTDTRAVWGDPQPAWKISYQYEPKYPHAGAGKRIQF